MLDYLVGIEYAGKLYSVPVSLKSDDYFEDPRLMAALAAEDVLTDYLSAKLRRPYNLVRLSLRVIEIKSESAHIC
jgi:hypothetical protein